MSKLRHQAITVACVKRSTSVIRTLIYVPHCLLFSWTNLYLFLHFTLRNFSQDSSDDSSPSLSLSLHTILCSIYTIRQEAWRRGAISGVYSFAVVKLSTLLNNYYYVHCFLPLLMSGKKCPELQFFLPFSVSECYAMLQCTTFCILHIQENLKVVYSSVYNDYVIKHPYSIWDK